MKNFIYAFSFLFLATNIFAQPPATIPVKPDVILVQGGTFKMGSNLEDDEKPLHSVTLSTFSIGKYEVTVGQFKAFCTEIGRSMPEPPEWSWQENHPIVNVNYNDAVAYCNWLGERFGGDWRLPTEAEWEYAARGGNKSLGSTYSGGNNLESVAWFADNAGGQTNSVGAKQPNELGIYDMSGNVFEWCSRGRHDFITHYKSSSSNHQPRTPPPPSTGSDRVSLGGSWRSRASYCRVASRTPYSPDRRDTRFGFRVVLY